MFQNGKVSLKERSLKWLSETRPGRWGIHKAANSIGYIAGSSLEEGLQSVEDYYEQGRLSTFDILGETSTTKKQADDYLFTYLMAMDIIAERYPDMKPMSISLKPTTICAVKEDGVTLEDNTPLEERLEMVLEQAEERGFDVTLDMEDHDWTDRTLDAAAAMWEKGYKNFGIVLQTNLDRTILPSNGTREDVWRYIEARDYGIPRDKIRVRACIGIYREPEEIATRDKAVAKRRLITMVDRLFEAGVYVEIATHDHDVIREIIDTIIEPKGISLDRFEFQFLKGVENAYQIEDFLKERDYKIRYYMPTEINKYDGVPYMTRRLTRNPDMVRHAAKNVLQKIGFSRQHQPS